MKMKRLTGIVAALVLLLCAVCAAAESGEVFRTDYFTLQLPAGWVTDYEDLETDDEMKDLGFFGEDKDVGLVAGAYLVYYEDLKDLSLWGADEDTLQDYIDSILDEFKDDQPVYLGTVMAGNIPLVLIRAADGDGEYLYADTITNGYAIQIQAYIADDSDDSRTLPLDDESIELFKTVLATFQPVT